MTDEIKEGAVTVLLVAWHVWLVIVIGKCIIEMM